MMKDKLISVIVPVYKTEVYLRQCVDSIRNQTYRNLEIILVDDGSPDRSGQLCEELALEDPRIRVIHKENGGLSSARNAGLDVMTGDLVAFVDSDDWILPRMYECLHSLMQQYQTRIAAGGLQTSKGKHYNHFYPQKKDVEIFTCNEALIEITINRKITNSVCDKLWDKTLFDYVRFPNGAIFEDIRTTYKLLEQVHQIVYTPEPLYIYRVMDESISRGQFHPRMLESVYANKERALYYEKRHPTLYGYAMAAYIRIGLMQLWEARRDTSCTMQKKEIITDLRKQILPEVLSQLNWKNKLKLCALSMGLPVFYLVMGINFVYTICRGEERT